MEQEPKIDEKWITENAYQFTRGEIPQTGNYGGVLKPRRRRHSPYIVVCIICSAIIMAGMYAWLHSLGAF